ncbi:TIGR00266 family protein [Olleya aquimaris]|uniref:TIGR00266 family protein n=1 Tax=Olleya sediminilitoris TaxID=2795739 RepID=A0ABS1WPH4_9FLAO|nr:MULTISPECIES: TIGR00266 family protein [Olleya]AXO79912.1 TIGR00266 family protein [Olleya aquimaris]MBL7561017.1 TIGR00266 family protein [Olleya sediminilitoris]
MYQKDQIPNNNLNAHEIDFEIFGEEMQYVEIELDPEEGVIAEAGSFMMMDDGIKMETIFGDGSQKDTGFLGKVFGAGKRLLTGESLFMTAFYNNLTGKRKVSFASPYPGKIVAIDLLEYNGKFICQKDAFLCAAKGVSVGVEFSKKLGRGLFGGEGFIMQKLEGDGLTFVHAGGTLARKVLKPGETLRVDTGCIVGFTQDVNYDIEFVGGIKNTVFGGEGLFFAKLEGPGVVYIQSLPFSRLAGRVLQSVPSGGKSKGEGSILGGLGDLLDGDNRF